jgi:hypothetical protein
MAKPETLQLLVVCIILSVAVVGGWYIVDNIRDKDPMQDKQLLSRGMDLPVIWVYVNNSEVNARSWADFQARSSRVMNIPFLNLCFLSFDALCQLSFSINNFLLFRF